MWNAGWKRITLIELFVASATSNVSHFLYLPHPIYLLLYSTPAGTCLEDLTGAQLDGRRNEHPGSKQCLMGDVSP